MPRKSQHERKILGIEEDGNAKCGSPVFEKVSCDGISFCRIQRFS